MVLYRFQQSGGGNGPTGDVISNMSRAWDTTANYTRAKTGVNWISPGGDFSNSVAFELPGHSGGAGYDTFPVTDRIKTFYQNPGSNHGIGLSFTGADSRAYRSHRSAVAVQRPALVITYDGSPVSVDRRSARVTRNLVSGGHTGQSAVRIGLNGVRLMPGTGCVSRVARISGGGVVVEIKGR